MTKLDRISFARLCSWIARRGSIELDNGDCQEIDEICTIVEPITNSYSCYMEPAKIDALMRELFNPNGMIGAIKEYRSLTGTTLKEAKEAVEKVRGSRLPKERMLVSLQGCGDKLGHELYGVNKGVIERFEQFIESF